MENNSTVKSSFNPLEHLSKTKGNKDYLEVKWRLVWLCEKEPNYRIRSELVTTPVGVKGVTVRAEVDICNIDNIVIRSATGYKTSNGFAGGDIEKAETGAIGRALALLGYGTQFALELEGDHPDLNPVDSPANAKEQLKPASQLPPPTNANKPQNKSDPELEKLPKYEHGDVPKEDRATKTQVAAFRQLGTALFNLTGADLNKRLLAAVSKIIAMNVSSLEGLHHTDAQSALEAIEQHAIKKGVWSSQAEAV
jgi:hypothetical protein